MILSEPVASQSMALLTQVVKSGRAFVFPVVVFISACSYESGSLQTTEIPLPLPLPLASESESAQLLVESAQPTTKVLAKPSAELSADQSLVQANEPMTVTFTVTNDTGQNHRILTWASPLEEEITGVMFRVSKIDATASETDSAGSEAKAIPFSGLMVRRGPPPDDAFIDLEPGEEISNSVSLDSSYDVSSSGQYLIEFMPLTATDNNSFMMGDAEISFGNRKVIISRR